VLIKNRCSGVCLSVIYLNLLKCNLSIYQSCSKASAILSADSCYFFIDIILLMFCKQEARGCTETLR